MVRSLSHRAAEKGARQSQYTEFLSSNCQFIVALAALLPTLALADSVKVNLVSESAVASRLAAGVVKQEEREGVVQKLFAEAGCVAELQKVDKRSSNVICRIPGESEAEIVVSAHYDYVRDGQGIVDDWTGTSLLPSLFQALSGKPRKHTFVFAAFAAEEKGLVGSRRFVKELSKDARTNIRAQITLECLGMTPFKVWKSRSERRLIEFLLQVTTATGHRLEGVDVGNVGDDDTRPFRDAGIPVISLHSVSQEKFPILHSKSDNLQAVSPSELYTTYRTVAIFLAHLDAKLD